MEVFQNMWFTPIRERPTLDSAALIRKVMNITDVVAASRDMGLEWFEQLLLSVSIYTILQHYVALYTTYC
jgi:cohesin loading factor subunit SCC2